MELNFALSTHLKANKTARITLNIYVSQKERKSVRTPFSVGPADFDEAKQRVKSSHPNYLYINRSLTELRDTWERAIAENIGHSLDAIENIVSSSSYLSDFIDMYIKKCESGTIKKTYAVLQYYKATLTHLLNFEKAHPRPRLETVDKAFYDAFHAYLTGTLKHNINTSSKYLSTIKLFIGQAREYNYKVSDAIDKKWWVAPRVDFDKISLTPQEIDQIFKCELPEHLQAERDRFICAYYFLLRYSDTRTFNSSNFISEAGKMYYVDRSEKTDTRIRIPVKPILIEVLERNDWSFPKGHNAEANWKLKDIGRIAKINTVVNINGVAGEKWLHITTHTARRSGATNLAKAGVPTRIIMQLGGWKKESSFLSYLRMTPDDISGYAAGLEFYS